MRLLASPLARLGLALGALAAILALLASQDLLAPARIRDLVEGAPVAAPVVFVLLYALLTVLLIPGGVRSLVAGALFGPVWGTVVTVIGATLGATIAFLIARSVGRAHVERITGSRIARIDRWITDRGLGAVLFVRLVPLFPFNTVNYAAGLTGLRLRTFAVGTLFGITPGTAAYVGLGAGLDAPNSRGFLASAAVLVGLSLAGILALRLAGPDRDRRDGFGRDRGDDGVKPGDADATDAHAAAGAGAGDSERAGNPDGDTATPPREPGPHRDESARRLSEPPGRPDG